MIPHLLAVFSIGDLMQILGWAAAFVVSVLTLIVVPTLKAKWQAQAKAEVVIAGPQPFVIKGAEEYVTRREFKQLETTMIGHISEMKNVSAASSSEMRSLFQQTMSAVTSQTTATNNKIERQHRTQMEEIGKVAAAAHAGREKIWIQVNEQRETLGGLSVAGDVALGLNKIADALNPPQTKVQPMHSNPSHGS